MATGSLVDIVHVTRCPSIRSYKTPDQINLIRGFRL